LDKISIEALKRAAQELELEIQLLGSGQRAILDIKDGKILEVSRDVLLEKRVHGERLSGLVAKLEAGTQ
jgi:hypothetical protein